MSPRIKSPEGATVSLGTPSPFQGYHADSTATWGFTPGYRPAPLRGGIRHARVPPVLRSFIAVGAGRGREVPVAPETVSAAPETFWMLRKTFRTLRKPFRTLRKRFGCSENRSGRSGRRFGCSENRFGRSGSVLEPSGDVLEAPEDVPAVSARRTPALPAVS